MKPIIIFILISILLVPNKRTKKVSAQKLNAAQIEVFQVLRNKCNVCHLKQNTSKVFTLKNMNGFARKIKRQVFILKRMPKGNEIKVTVQEKQILKNWINN